MATYRQGQLSPPMTRGTNSSPFSQSQLNFIHQLLENRKQDFTNEIDKLKTDIKAKDNQILQLEKDLIDVQQYVRRNNIVTTIDPIH